MPDTAEDSPAGRIAEVREAWTEFNEVLQSGAPLMDAHYRLWTAIRAL